MKLMKIIRYVSIIIALGMLLYSCGSDINRTSKVEWGEPVYPGVWKSNIGKPDKINLLNVLNKSPKSDALGARSSKDFPIDETEIKISVKDNKTFIRLPLDSEEQIFGLGLNFKSIDQRGRIMRLHTDHYGNSDNGRTHAPVPFFVSSKGYGVLFNAARYIDVYVGSGVRVDSKNPPEALDRNTDRNWNANPYSDNLEIVIPAEGVEVVVFAGDNMLDVVSRFNLYCGSGFIPPKWGLGFWHRVPTLYNEKDVMTEVSDFSGRGFPLDVIGLEPGWHSAAYPCTFEWDKSRFADPDKFIADLNNINIKTNLWANPYISPKSSMYNKILPHCGTHTVWCGIVPDFLTSDARKIFGDHISKEQIKIGVSGYKIDEVDGVDAWLWPDAAEFPSGATGEQMRQIYGNTVMSVIEDEYRAENKRTYGLVRGTNAGGVSFPYVIYNDNYSHRDFITAISSSSFIGVMWTPEVRAGGDSEEWLRRMQTTCFAPIAMINAWADGTKPWSYPEVYDACVDAAKLRMQLLPYLYSVFSNYYLEGIPPFRAMNLCEGFSGHTNKIKTQLDATNNPYETVIVKEVKDQYMIGDNILAAPIFAGDASRNVVLPKGKWFDFYTGDYVGENQIINISGKFDKLPLFVRDGGIVPMIPPVLNTSEWVKGQPIEVRIYGSADGEFNLYDDDGESYDYENGNYTIKKLKREDGKFAIEDVKSGNTWSYNNISWKQM